MIQAMRAGRVAQARQAGGVGHLALGHSLLNVAPRHGVDGCVRRGAERRAPGGPHGADLGLGAGRSGCQNGGVRHGG